MRDSKFEKVPTILKRKIKVKLSLYFGDILKNMRAAYLLCPAFIFFNLHTKKKNILPGKKCFTFVLPTMMNFFASHSKITSTIKNENHALIKNVQLNCPSIENKTSLYRQILFHSIDSSSTINCYSLNLKIFLRQVLHPHLISLQVFIP